MSQTEAADRQREQHPAPPRKSSSGWSKTVVNFWVDCLLLVLFLLLVWVSAVLRFLFPAGPAEQEWELWGGDVEFWRGLQFGLLCLLALGIVLHVMLHWSWVCGVVARNLLGRSPSKNDGTQTLVGVGVLLGILHVLAAALIIAWISLRQQS
jgi:hypothetical protein